MGRDGFEPPVFSQRRLVYSQTASPFAHRPVIFHFLRSRLPASCFARHGLHSYRRTRLFLELPLFTPNFFVDTYLLHTLHQAVPVGPTLLGLLGGPNFTPFATASFIFSLRVPRKRWRGFTHRRLSHLWQTSTPSGIFPLASSQETRCADFILPAILILP